MNETSRNETSKNETSRKGVSQKGSKPYVRYLSESQAQRIHQASLEILERVGVDLYEQEALDLFRSAGARVEEGGRVYLSEKLVDWGRSVAPSTITLHDRNGEAVMPLKQGAVYFGTGSDCLYVLDHRTGERRLATLSDIEEIFTVCDALPNIDFLMSAGVPSDVSSKAANRLQMLGMITKSTKPIMFVTNDFESSMDIIKAAELIAGGEKAHREKPYTCCYINVTDPLRHNDEALQKLLYFAEKGLPTTYTPMVLRGVNGPVTRAGAIALANAGELVGLVLAQLKKEGAPIIHGGGYADGFDMSTSIGIYAGPESYGGRAAMAAYYGLPSFGLGGSSDSKVLDEQAVSEAALTIMSEAMGEVNLVHDVGYLESGKCYSLELLTLCNEIIGYVRRYAAGFEVNDETLALDLIVQQGTHGEYLSTDHTIEHFREDWFPELFDRNNFDGWMQKGATTMGDRITSKIEDILAGHTPQPLDPKIEREIRTILEGTPVGGQNA